MVALECRPELVGRAVGVEPLLGRRLGPADLLADLGVEDLRPAAGEAAQPGVDQLLQDLAGREPGDLLEPLDLDAGVRLHVDLGRGLLHPADHVHVVRERQLVVQPADDVQLGRPPGVGLAGALLDLVLAHRVGAGVVHVGAEGAEVALVHAHVGGVEVRVDVVIAEIAVVALADEVRHLAQREQVGRRLQGQPVVEREALAGLDLLADRRQPCRPRSPIARPLREEEVSVFRGPYSHFSPD